jgi:putative transcriptional regulator
MGLRIRLDQLLLDRRMSLAELADRTGLTATNLTLLRNGEAQAIRVATLEALCRELRCQPGDLLEYEGEVTPTEAASTSD